MNISMAKNHITRLVHTYSIGKFIPWVIAILFFSGYFLFARYILNQIAGENEALRELLYMFSIIQGLIFTTLGFFLGKEINDFKLRSANEKAEQLHEENKSLANDILNFLPPPESDSSMMDTTESRLETLRRIAKKHLNEVD